MDVDLPERQVGFGLTISFEAVRSANYDEFAEHLYEAAEALADDMTKSILEDIGVITEATGNVVDAGGELTFEKVYEMMDGMEWGLTDEGGVIGAELRNASRDAGEVPCARDARDASCDGGTESAKVRGSSCSKAP